DLSTFQRPSSDLRTAYTSTNLFFDAPEVADFVGRNRGAELHAPRSFDSGSSISHLDEFAFRAGSENALMTPQLSFREAVHDPGPIGLGILQALGWEIAQATVTSTAQIQVENISVFPNPTRDQVRIVWPQDFPNEMNYQLYDQLGRTLLNGNITQQDQINLSQLPPGNYHLFLQSAERQFRTQIVLLE
ncbi:MAG: T9SS type A sorting domain-containing protein, partial [Bacteroidota bacterium]